jgi:hypothetical protein
MNKIDYSKITAIEMGEFQWEQHKDLFEEKPPTIEQFLNDDYYLGLPECGIKESHYPIWKKHLKKLHPHPFLPAYNEAITSGAIGIGKTFGFASLSGLYVLCFHLCMIKPPAFYKGLDHNTTLVMKLFSSSIEKADEVNWSDIQKIIKYSPFFQKYVLQNNTKSSKEIELRGKKFEFRKNIKIEVASTIEHAQGEAIIVLIYDEANGKKSKNKDPNKAYLDLLSRRKSRLLMQGSRVGGIFHLLGEAEGEDTFLEKRKEGIKQEKTKGVYILENISQWEAKKHLGLFNSRNIPNLIEGSFRVFLGNTYQDPFIIEKEDINTLDGEIIEVPNSFYTDFYQNLAHAIKKLAGRASSRSSKLFKNKKIVYSTFILPNLFNKDILELAFYNDDRTVETNIHIQDFVKDMKRFIKPINPFLYRFLHVDGARTKDRLSCSSTYAEYRVKEYYKTYNNDEFINSNKLTNRIYNIEFTLTLQAKKGQEIPLMKFADFITYIRDVGYPIFKITTDQREGTGAFLRQEFSRRGFLAEYLSVDTSKIPYETLLNIMTYGSIVGVKSDLGIFELINLNQFSEKIDHDDDKSKDVSDGICGSVFSCFSSDKIFNPSVLLIDDKFKQDLYKLDNENDNILDNFLDSYF